MTAMAATTKAMTATMVMMVATAGMAAEMAAPVRATIGGCDDNGDGNDQGLRQQ